MVEYLLAWADGHSSDPAWEKKKIPLVLISVPNLKDLETRV